MKSVLIAVCLSVIWDVTAAAQAPKIVTVLKGFDTVELIDTLGIDAQTGRILQITYRDRKNVYGDVVKMFSDFRPVEGLVLPFKVEESFNGKPQTSPLVTVDTVTLNAKLDTKLFRN